jgi:hypothetical protein
VSEKADCPHCGAYKSSVYYEGRCSCGWADPVLHEPQRPRVELDLSPEEAEAALADSASLLAEIREQLARPPLSRVDRQPVLYQERRRPWLRKETPS